MNEIDLSILHSNTKDIIEIDNDYEIPKDYYKDSNVKDIKKLHAKGFIKKDLSGSDFIQLSIKAVLILEDSISLEPIEYPISIEINGKLEEFLEKSTNRLDIFEFLWENIVLEVPLKFTKVEDFSEFHGDGWSLMSEDDKIHEDNPFNEILKEFGKE